MKTIISIFLKSIAVYLTAEIFDAVVVDGFFTAIIVALILGILNHLVKPILVVLTIPITIFSLGLFLIVINALIIEMADFFIDGFHVKSFTYSILFSIALSIITSIIEKIDEKLFSKK